jgi:phage terminase Nu1 subunit (DNA packaging protein)
VTVERIVCPHCGRIVDLTTVETHATAEAYVSAQSLAMLMGVSKQTIGRWTQEGMPSETWGTKLRRYRPTEAMAWARQHRPS